MFTANPQAFLDGSRPGVGPFFQPQEDVFKLVHPGVGKKQRRVIFGN